jgi:hypothetical protein
MVIVPDKAPLATPPPGNRSSNVRMATSAEFQVLFQILRKGGTSANSCRMQFTEGAERNMPHDAFALTVALAISAGPRPQTRPHSVPIGACARPAAT